MELVNVHNGSKVRIFNTLALETAALCNRKCVFCPNYSTARPDELMPMELIQKVLEELREIKWKGVFNTWIYNEPLRDKRLPEILKMTQEILPTASVMLSTNGDYLKNKNDLNNLYDMGVRQIVINIYSAADGCGNSKKEEKGIEIAKKRGDEIEGWIQELKLDTNGAMYSYAPKGSRRARVERKYGIKPSTDILGKSFELQNRSGNIDWFMPTITEPLQKTCVRPFRILNINWKGDSLLCCNDYHGEVTFGNIRDRNIVDIWNDQMLNYYRVALQNKERNIALCHNCDYSGGHFKHMVDTVTFGSEKADKKVIESILRNT